MLSLAVLLALPSAHAATLVVNSQGGAAFTTISGAVSAAANNDRIEVVFGTYVENVAVGTKRLTIVAQDPRAQITLADASAATEPLISVSTGQLTLEGFRLVGDVYTGEPDPDAEAVRVCSFDPFSSDGLELELQGVSVAGGTLTVRDSSFVCLSSLTQGAAISGDGTLVVESTEFTSNAAEFGGGAIDWRGTMTVSSSTFFDNAAVVGGGGAIQHTGDVGTVEASFFRYNTSFFEGGALSMRGSDAILRHNTFQENATNVFAGIGGGVYTNSAELELMDNLFCGNFSDMGAGLYTEGIPLVTIENNVFSDNWGAHYGGGMYLEAGDADDSVSIVNNTFIANEAGRVPPPDFTVLVIGGGGAMMLDGTLAEFTNNIVSGTRFGAGVGGVDGPNYVIGDLIQMDYNAFWFNCDNTTNCTSPDPTTWQDFSGDLASHILLPTNVFDNPRPIYVEDGEFDCFPDAFYPAYTSPVVDRGDPAIEDLGGSRSDIGAYGGPGAHVLDRDADGYENIYDCDDRGTDTSPVDGVADGFTTHPDAVESCDFKDNNCNGFIDEGFQIEWWNDTDGDGFGAEDTVARLACAQPIATVPNDLDCDDTDGDISPISFEICNDIDDDCSGVADDALATDTYFRDADDDGYGDYRLASFDPGLAPPQPVVNSCAPIAGYAITANDCDDEDDTVNPSVAEVCGDNEDNDCDGETDEAEGAVNAVEWALDADSDGFASDATVTTCGAAPDGDYILVVAGAALDCDDDNIAVNPDAAEVCNDLDDDCDDEIDNDPTNALTWYLDADGDAFGDDDITVQACDPPGDLYVLAGGDCDDNNEVIGECTQCSGCNLGGASAPSFGVLFLALLFVRRRESGR